MASPDFGGSVNPISTGGTDYAHLITTGTPGFSDLPTALQLVHDVQRGPSMCLGRYLPLFVLIDIYPFRQYKGYKLGIIYQPKQNGIYFPRRH